MTRHYAIQLRETSEGAYGLVYRLPTGETLFTFHAPTPAEALRRIAESLSGMERFTVPNERGQVARKVHGETEAAVVPQLFNAKITKGHVDDDTGYDEEWSYATLDKALTALETWDLNGEPSGWIKHLPSGRRQTENL